METITFGIDAGQCWKNDVDHFGSAADAVRVALEDAFPTMCVYAHSTDDATEGCPDNAVADAAGRAALKAFMATECVCGADHDCRSEGCDEECPACCG